jgi:Phytanoyl-CoA dioxygenase (PhyH)
MITSFRSVAAFFDGRMKREQQKRIVGNESGEAMNGYIDLFTTARISGWAKRSDGAAVTIDIVNDGTIVSTTRASIARDDVGPCGFDLLIDPPLPRDALITVKADGEVLLTGHPKATARTTPVKHRLRVPLYLSPFRDEIADEERWEPSRTAASQEYAARGLVRGRIESPDFAARAQRIMKLDYGNQTRMMDVWTRDEDVRALACDPGVLRLLGDLYGREAVPMQTLNFRVGTEQSTHSDTIHFNSEPENFMCGVWVALEPITDDNGPLHYYPGSHLWPIINLDDIGAVAGPGYWSENYECHQQVLGELVRVRGMKKERLLAEPGDVIVWAANLLHGGEPIVRPGTTRHSQVTHYYFKGCSYFTPMESNLHIGELYRDQRRDIRTGEPMRHYFDDELLPFGVSARPS